jgi:hypothetical protein
LNGNVGKTKGPEPSAAAFISGSGGMRLSTHASDRPPSGLTSLSVHSSSTTLRARAIAAVNTASPSPPRRSLNTRSNATVRAPLALSRSSRRACRSRGHVSSSVV